MAIDTAPRAVGRRDIWPQAKATERRPITETWSIAEYTDHVREVLFGMRFVLDSAITQPGIELGEIPEQDFSLEPRSVDITMALAGIDREAQALRDRLTALSESSWSATATTPQPESARAGK